MVHQGISSRKINKPGRPGDEPGGLPRGHRHRPGDRPGDHRGPQGPGARRCSSSLSRLPIPVPAPRTRWAETTFWPPSRRRCPLARAAATMHACDPPSILEIWHLPAEKAPVELRENRQSIYGAVTSRHEHNERTNCRGSTWGPRTCCRNRNPQSTRCSNRPRRSTTTRNHTLVLQGTQSRR